MYIVIVGAGGIGQNLTSIALKNRDDVVVIEKDKEKCEEFSKKYDAVVINADATVKRPLIKDFMSLGGHAEIFKIVLPEHSKLVGKKLKDIDLPKRVSIIAIERNSDIIIPIPDTTLAAGDSVTVLAREDKIDKAMELFAKKK